MKRFLFFAFISLSASAFSQIADTKLSRDCYILYEYNGNDFSKNKKAKANSPITVIDEFKEIKDYYRVKYKNIEGYVSLKNIYINDDMQSYLNKKEEDNNKKLLEEKLEREKLNKGREEYEREKFKTWYPYVKRHEIKIGMPEYCIIPSIGQPNKINTSEYSFGIHKQYVYDNMYIYVENEKVTAIQETK